MDKLRRIKPIESPLGRTYFVVIETDKERGEHYVRIYDQNPEPEPVEVRVFGLTFTLSPPVIEPIIERSISILSDLQQRLEEMIYRYELPEIQLQRLDTWDGVVRWRPPEPTKETDASGAKKKTKKTANTANVIRFKDWRDPEIICYDRSTGRVWTERAEGGGAK